MLQQRCEKKRRICPWNRSRGLISGRGRKKKSRGAIWTSGDWRRRQVWKNTTWYELRELGAIRLLFFFPLCERKRGSQLECGLKGDTWFSIQRISAHGFNTHSALSGLNVQLVGSFHRVSQYVFISSAKSMTVRGLRLWAPQERRTQLQPPVEATLLHQRGAPENGGEDGAGRRQDGRFG